MKLNLGVFLRDFYKQREDGRVLADATMAKLSQSLISQLIDLEMSTQNRATVLTRLHQRLLILQGKAQRAQILKRNPKWRAAGIRA